MAKISDFKQKTAEELAESGGGYVCVPVTDDEKRGLKVLNTRLRKSPGNPTITFHGNDKIACVPESRWDSLKREMKTRKLNVDKRVFESFGVKIDNAVEEEKISSDEQVCVDTRKFRTNPDTFLEMLRLSTLEEVKEHKLYRSFDELKKDISVDGSRVCFSGSSVEFYTGVALEWLEQPLKKAISITNSAGDAYEKIIGDEVRAVRRKRLGVNY